MLDYIILVRVIIFPTRGDNDRLYTRALWKVHDLNDPAMFDIFIGLKDHLWDPLFFDQLFD